jgi:hypothetical protein
LEIARINRLRELGPIQEKRGEYHSLQSTPRAPQQPVHTKTARVDEQNQGFPHGCAVTIRDKQIKLRLFRFSRLLAQVQLTGGRAGKFRIAENF